MIVSACSQMDIDGFRSVTAVSCDFCDRTCFRLCRIIKCKIVIKIVSSNCFCHLIFISICRGSTVDYSGVTLLVLKFDRTNKTKR